MTQSESQVSHMQIPATIVDHWIELETKVRDAISEVNFVLGSLDTVRQELEDAAVQAKLASDRLGEEAIARIKAEVQTPSPSIETYRLAVELAARQVLDVCWSPRGYADTATATVMKLLRDSVHKLDLAKQDANQSPPTPSP